MSTIPTQFLSVGSTVTMNYPTVSTNPVGIPIGEGWVFDFDPKPNWVTTTETDFKLKPIAAGTT